MSSAQRHPITPDGRYFVVGGRLWRMSNPELDQNVRAELVSELMAARREVGEALRRVDEQAVAIARRKVDQAKQALGERGPVWWSDPSPDYNRRRVVDSPYADWFGSLKD